MAEIPHETLGSYLQLGMPQIIVNNERPGKNTTNRIWDEVEIETLRWAEFNVERIYNICGHLLNEVMLVQERPLSAPEVINSENGFCRRFASTLDGRLRRALRATMLWIRPAHSIILGEGDLDTLQSRYKPDLGFYHAESVRGQGAVNLLPGEIKCSWKWRSEWEESTSPSRVVNWRRPWKQLDHYMGLYDATYGFLLTDTELIVAHRGTGEHRLYISEPIPWTAHGTADAPVLTPALALWYLAMGLMV